MGRPNYGSSELRVKRIIIMDWSFWICQLSWGTLARKNICIINNDHYLGRMSENALVHTVWLVVPWWFHGGSMVVPWWFHVGSMVVPWWFYGGSIKTAFYFSPSWPHRFLKPQLPAQLIFHNSSTAQIGTQYSAAEHQSAWAKDLRVALLQPMPMKMHWVWNASGGRTFCRLNRPCTVHVTLKQIVLLWKVLSDVDVYSFLRVIC